MTGILKVGLTYFSVGAFATESTYLIDTCRPVKTLVHLTIVDIDVAVLTFPTVHTCAPV